MYVISVNTVDTVVLHTVLYMKLLFPWWKKL